jgi:hypothetical protein
MKTLVSEKIVSAAIEALEKPEGIAEELRRLKREEPELYEFAEEHLAVVGGLVAAWKPPGPARQRIEQDAWSLIASLHAAWRLALLKRWTAKSGIDLDGGGR